MVKHYETSKVVRSLAHFLTGKAFAAASTLAVLFLLARSLSKPDFAVYMVFEAVIGLTGLIASFGINQTVLRYSAELRAANNGLALYSLIRSALLSRALVFGLALLLLYAASPWIAGRLGFGAHLDLFHLYLLVGWLGLICTLTGAVMETLLWQKTTQYTYALTAALRLFLLGSSYLFDQVDLHRVISIDIIYESVTLLLLLAGLWRNYVRDPNRRAGSLDWFHDNRKRITRYALAGYGYALSTLLYGSQPNRAVSARYLPPHAMGDFGFADSLANLFSRFLPSNLLQGFIRPLYFVRYAETRQLRHLERLANLIFRVNLVLMSVAALILLLYGGPLLGALTAGKYAGTVYLVVAMLGLLVLESLQNQHILLCQTLEKNHLLIYANLLRSGSLLAAIPLFVSIGAWAVVLANVTGNLLAIGFVRWTLGRAGQTFGLDLALIARAMLNFSLALLVGLYAQEAGSLFWGGLFGLSAYLVSSLIVRPFSGDELGTFVRRIREYRQPRQERLT